MTIELTTPPRPTGNPVDDVAQLNEYCGLLQQVLVTVRDAMEKIATVAALSQEISASPTQAQVQALQDKVNEVLTAAKAE